MLRGGSWQDSIDAVQTTRRTSALPQHRHQTIGFRIARTLGVSELSKEDPVAAPEERQALVLTSEVFLLILTQRK